MSTHRHDHVHDHDHDAQQIFHAHAPAHLMKRAFFWTGVILLVELGGGILSHSLALLSDAGHVLTDIAAIGLSWYAIVQARKPADARMTYGYHRSGILAALINGVSLMVITLIILAEAYRRFQHPTAVSSNWMFVSAGVGLTLNLSLGLTMRHEDNINVRSAVLHMLGDAAASAGVIVGGIVIALTSWEWVDPALSVLIALLIALGAWRIVKQAAGILMEGTPRGIEIDRVVDRVRSIDGIHDVHDVHVWCITSGRNALSCHVVLDGDLTIRDSQHILRNLEHQLVHLGIGHVTIQVEDGDHPHDGSVLCCDEPATRQLAHE